MSDFLAKVTAQLDTSAAESKMASFLKDKTLKVKVDLDTGNVNINNFLNQIKAQFGRSGNIIGANLANSINNSLNDIDLSRTKTEILNLRSALQNLGFNNGSIDSITKDLDNLKVAVTGISHNLSGNRLDVTVDGVDSLGRTVTAMQSFNAQSGALISTSSRVRESFKQMFTKLDVSKLNADISALDANFIKLRGSINGESTELNKLKQDLANISQIQDLGSRQAEFERITQSVKKLGNTYKQAKAEAESAAAAQQLMTSKNILGNQITTWMNNNTKAAKIYGNELRDLQARLQAVSNTSQLKDITQGFREIQTTAAAAGRLGKSVFGQLIGNITKLSPLFGMGAILTNSIRTVKNMVSTVYELDTALVDLKKTTTMSDSELESFYNGASAVAKEMGVSTAEIINQAAAWSRLGYSSKDAAEAMAKLSSQFAAISPGMDVEKATDGLVSTMKAFGIETDNVLDGIMSKINIVGNTAATSNADIVDMLTRSSSAMSEANNSLEQTIALETAAVEITQDAASVGTAYKTIAMRIRGYDEETQAYTNDVEELSGKIADLTKTASTPGGISLFTDATKKEFKSTYQLFEEISNIYDKLSDKNQAELLEVLAGKRQGQRICPYVQKCA